MPVKVAIVTLFHNNTNYGAILQAYALQKTIESLGCECIVLNYHRNVTDIAHNQKSKIQKVLLKLSSINSRGDLFNLCYYPFQKKWSAKYAEDIRNRKLKINKFISENIPTSEVLESESIHKTSDEFDVFVCGSDQIWRPTTFDPNFFLDFVKQEKRRIAYAASLGVMELSGKEKEIYAPLVNHLDAISVREASAIPVISSLTKKKVVRVLDPTLLLDCNHWTTYCHDMNHIIGNTVNKGFIFSYQIGENNVNRDLAKKAGKLLGMDVVTIPGVSRLLPYDFYYSDINLVDASPEDFLSLIEQSECVITDSFHACVFAILFGKKLIALERFSKGDRLSMNSRIYDLLEIFSITDRLLTTPSQLDHLLDSEMNVQFDQWQHLISTSREFLTRNILGE